MSRLPSLTAITALLALLSLCEAASASPVLHVTASGVEHVDDPYLPATLEPAPRGVPEDPPPVAGGSAARTVPGAVKEALGAGAIDQVRHDGWLSSYKEAKTVKKRLPGLRKKELGRVIDSMGALARGGLLSPSRLAPTFLELERNTLFWREKPIPGAGARLTFGNSQIVFQYYPGQGLRIQPLANFAKANGFYNACKGINVRPGTPCRKQSFAAMLDELLALGAVRGKPAYTAWEYYFTFDGGRPPWVSSLSQGTAIQAFARGTELLGDPKYAAAATAGIGAFEQRPPTGVAVPADGGTHYVIYSFLPRFFVLNAFIQSLNGLYDYSTITGDPRGLGLFNAGEAAARVQTRQHDTGAWSLYGRGGRESTLGYHRLVRDFLSGLCDRTQTDVYCTTAASFTRYLHEKPKLEWLGRKGRTIKFRLSKLSTVTVTARVKGKSRVISSKFVGYGVKSYGLPKGASSVKVRAKDLRNHPTQLVKSI